MSYEFNKKRVGLIMLFVLAMFLFIWWLYIMARRFRDAVGWSKNKYADHVRQWEGGLSSASSDTASNDPMNGISNGNDSGYHTNKGIQFKVFKEFFTTGDYSGWEPADGQSWGDFFKEMTDEHWQDIFYGVYWDDWNLDRINCMPVASIVHSYKWGSGNAGAEVQIANWLRSQHGINDSNITPDEIIIHLNELTKKFGCKIIFDDLVEERRRLYTLMSTYPANGVGWNNRLDSLVEKVEDEANWEGGIFRFDLPDWYVNYMRGRYEFQKRKNK